jgi:hypothetical protein
MDRITKSLRNDPGVLRFVGISRSLIRHEQSSDDQMTVSAPPCAGPFFWPSLGQCAGTCFAVPDYEMVPVLSRYMRLLRGWPQRCSTQRWGRSFWRLQRSRKSPVSDHGNSDGASRFAGPTLGSVSGDRTHGICLDR